MQVCHCGMSFWIYLLMYQQYIFKTSNICFHISSIFVFSMYHICILFYIFLYTFLHILCVLIFFFNTNLRITGLYFLPKTHLFFSGGRDFMVKEWDADNFQKIITLKVRKQLYMLLLPLHYTGICEKLIIY